jgi:hypothetical protein
VIGDAAGWRLTPYPAYGINRGMVFTVSHRAEGAYVSQRMFWLIGKNKKGAESAPFHSSQKY